MRSTSIVDNCNRRSAATTEGDGAQREEPCYEPVTPRLLHSMHTPVWPNDVSSSCQVARVGTCGVGRAWSEAEPLFLNDHGRRPID